MHRYQQDSLEFTVGIESFYRTSQEYQGSYIYPMTFNVEIWNQARTARLVDPAGFELVVLPSDSQLTFMDPEVILRQAQSHIRTTENAKVNEDAIHGTIAVIDFVDEIVSPLVDTKEVQAEKEKTKPDYLRGF